MINLCKIDPIFPTPLYRNILRNKINEDQINYVLNCDVYANENNLTSYDTYILNNDIFDDLKKELIAMVKDYYQSVMGINVSEVVPYITQSWINITKKGHKHHKHLHPNSLVSGVLYLKANDKINFYKKMNRTIDLPVKVFNSFSAQKFTVPVAKDHVLLFPSYLEHDVDKYERDDERISLSFNTFVKGVIGGKNNASELKL